MPLPVTGSPSTVIGKGSGPSAWASLSDGGASGGTYTRSANAGDRVHLAFNGTYISWFTREGPDQGVAKVFIDGVLMDSIIAAVYGKKPGIAVKNQRVLGGTYVIGCSKTRPELCAEVDKAIAALVADGRVVHLNLYRN